jgi:hypothetical protein
MGTGDRARIGGRIGLGRFGFGLVGTADLDEIGSDRGVVDLVDRWTTSRWGDGYG